MKKGKKPRNQPIFQNDRYSITEIPLNYAIDVSILVKGNKRHEKVLLLPQQFYSPLDRGLEEAKACAEYMIRKTAST